MVIQTVYRPEENLDYLEDWLNHHTKLGIEHFYMYDNGGSYWAELNYGFATQIGITEGYTRYGIKIKHSLEYAREKQKEIFSKYPVTVVEWQNRGSDGKLLYNQVKSIYHLTETVKSGLCAFIDIDEFIIQNEEFRESLMLQRKFKHRCFYRSVYDCHEYIPFNTIKWGPKAILDMKKVHNYKIDYIHCFELGLPISKNIFNHYNFNKVGWRWLSQNLHMFDPDWKYKNEKDWLKCIEHMEDTGLIK